MLTVAGISRPLTAGVSAALVALGMFAPPHVRAAEPEERPVFKQGSPLDMMFPAPRPASGDPIGPLADHMQDVVVDLAATQTGQPVQNKQKQIVSKLDLLIAELQKQCKGGGGGNPNPTKPMGSSVLAGGPGGSGPMHDPKSGTRVWGQLPPKARQQILQSETEGFPPGYEGVLASYYSRLAQGQSAPEAAVAGPTTQPANQ